MSFNNIKSKLRSEKGFTIVELLIVIVVIGILAAITIVAYNGVTARANATSAKSAAASALKKAEAYNAETTAYPVLPANLTESAAQTKSYGLNGVTFTTTAGSTAPTAKPASASTLIFYTCGGTGSQVAYWDYSLASPAWVTQTTGTCTSPVYVAAS